MTHLFVLPIEKDAYREANVSQGLQTINIPNQNFRCLIHRRMPAEKFETYPIPQPKSDQINKFIHTGIEYSCHAYRIQSDELDNYIYEQYYQAKPQKSQFEQIVEQKYQQLFYVKNDKSADQFCAFQDRCSKIKRLIVKHYKDLRMRMLAEQQKYNIMSNKAKKMTREHGTQTDEIDINVTKITPWGRLPGHGAAQGKRAASCVVYKQIGTRQYKVDLNFESRNQQWIV